MAGRLVQGYSSSGQGDPKAAGQPAFPSPTDVQPANTTPDLHAARLAFVDTALFKSRKLTNPVSNPSAGQAFDVFLGAVGYACGVKITIDATLTTTLIPSVSSRYPWNLITSIIYNDPSNDQSRQIWSGFQSHLRRRTAMRRFPYAPSVSSPISPAYGGGLYLAPTTLPSGTTQKLHFDLWIPFTVSEPVFTGGTDLRGIHSLASAKKRATLNITVNPNIYSATANDDALTYHNTGSDGCALTNLAMKFTEYYWAPTDPDGQGPVLPPTDDQMIIHELKTSKASALNVGDDTPFFLETGRTYRSLIAELMSNGLLTTGNVDNYSAPQVGATAVKFMLNDNNYLLWEDTDVYLSRIRDQYGQDLPVGTFLYDLRQREFNSDEYSDLAAILTLDPGFSTTQPSYMQILRECTYESDISQVAA